MRIVIAIVVWIAAVAGAVEVSSVVAGSIHHGSTLSMGSAGDNGGSSGSGSSSGSGGGGSGSVDPSSIRATDPQSLFRTTNFQRVLASARSTLGADARLDNFVVYPGYLAVTAVKSGSEVEFYADANGRSELNNTGGNPGDTALFSLSRVKANIPALLAHRIATIGGTPEAKLHYMIADLNPSTNAFQWLVYPLEGYRVEYFQAAGGTGQLFEYVKNSSTGLQPVGH